MAPLRGTALPACLALVGVWLLPRAFVAAPARGAVALEGSTAAGILASTAGAQPALAYAGAGQNTDGSDVSGNAVLLQFGFLIVAFLTFAFSQVPALKKVPKNKIEGQKWS